LKWMTLTLLWKNISGLRKKKLAGMVRMDDPNITMEEYIRLEEEKSQKHEKVFNWETAKYRRIWYDEDVHNPRSIKHEFLAIAFNDSLTSESENDNEKVNMPLFPSPEPTAVIWRILGFWIRRFDYMYSIYICFPIRYDEDVHDLRSVETEFLAIVFNDALASEVTLSCEPLVSPLNKNQIDFRISFDESDDENDTDKVNMPSSEPMVSYFNDLDYFKDFEEEFLAIIYNDALTSKLDLLTEPTEQNVLYFNDLFPFNIIYPGDLKSDKDNDNDKIDIKQPSKDMSIIPLPNKWIKDFVLMDSKEVNDSKEQAESSKKRSKVDHDKESVKKQKLKEEDPEKEELRACLDIVPVDDIAINVESLATKYPIEISSYTGNVVKVLNRRLEIDHESPVTTEEKVQKKNDVKARSMLLMALPNEHLMTLNQYKIWCSTNEINTAYGVSTANTQVSTASTQVSTDNLSDATVYAFLTSQPSGSQLVHEDLVQIYKTDRKITINGSDTAGYDKSKVECFNCHKLGHFTRDCKQPRNQDSRNRNQDISKRNVNVEETASNAMVAIDGGSQIPDNNRKGVGFVSYNAILPPPIGLFSPPKLDLSNSGLKEFQQPEIKRYGPKTSNSVSEDICYDFKESIDAPLVKELVLDDKLEKKTIFPTVTKIEFVRPKQQEKPGNLQLELQQKGVIDSGCYKHMTGKMSYLFEYEEIDGGYVAFGGDPKGGKITDTEYVILSPDFKLLDEIQVFLRVPTKNNIYTVDLKNIAPSGGNQSNGSAGKARVETVPHKDYILLPLWTQNPLLSSSSKDSLGDGFKPSGEEEQKDAKNLGNKDNEVLSIEEPRVSQEKDLNVNNTNNINTVTLTINAANIEDNVLDENIVYGCADDPNMSNLEKIVYLDNDEEVGAEANMTNLDRNIHVSPILTTRIYKDHLVKQIIRDLYSTPQTRRMTKNVTNYAMQDEILQFKLQQVSTLVDLPNGKRAIGTKWIYRNKKDERGIVIRNKARLVTQGYTQEEGIDYDEVFALVDRIETIRLFLAYALFKDFVVYQMDVKSAFLEDDAQEVPDKFYERAHFFLGMQVTQKDDGIFISQDKYVDEILKKFGFSTVKTASTPMVTSKPLLKDENAEDVNVHLYRSMIGSLMYLTSSRPYIMFVICDFWSSLMYLTSSRPDQ
nr:hypothetical protein [Tanacetum cinerariifolium]